jgi:hypothetical protein
MTPTQLLSIGVPIVVQLLLFAYVFGGLRTEVRNLNDTLREGIGRMEDHARDLEQRVRALEFEE